MLMVRPWKLPSIATTSSRPVTLRASFTAASLASAPLLVKKTRVRPAGRISARSARRRARAGEYVRPESGFWRIRAPCSASAAWMTGCAWPIEVTPQPAVRSRYLSPSSSPTSTPSPRSIEMGVLVKNGGMCAFSMAMVSDVPMVSSKSRWWAYRDARTPTGSVAEVSASSIPARNGCPLSVLALQRVPHGLDADQAVAKEEGVDAVLHARVGRVRRPLEEQDVVGEHGLELPLRVRP